MSYCTAESKLQYEDMEAETNFVEARLINQTFLEEPTGRPHSRSGTLNARHLYINLQSKTYHTKHFPDNIAQ